MPYKGTRLFTVNDAAAYADVSAGTIRRWLREDGLAKMQPAGPHGAIRIRQSDLDRFLARDNEQRLVARVSALTAHRAAA